LIDKGTKKRGWDKSSLVEEKSKLLIEILD